MKTFLNCTGLVATIILPSLSFLVSSLDILSLEPDALFNFHYWKSYLFWVTNCSQFWSISIILLCLLALGTALLLSGISILTWSTWWDPSRWLSLLCSLASHLRLFLLLKTIFWLAFIPYSNLPLLVGHEIPDGRNLGTYQIAPIPSDQKVMHLMELSHLYFYYNFSLDLSF